MGLIQESVLAVIQVLRQAHMTTWPGFPPTLRQIQPSGISNCTKITILPCCFSVHYAEKHAQGC